MLYVAVAAADEDNATATVRFDPHAVPSKALTDGLLIRSIFYVVVSVAADNANDVDVIVKHSYSSSH